MRSNSQITASEDKTARVWQVRSDTGTLADWERIAERSPFVLDDHGLLVRRSELHSLARPATDPATAGAAHGPLRTWRR